MHEHPGALVGTYNGIQPIIDGPLAFGGMGAAILGRTTLGKGAWLGDYSVIRADGHYVAIGDDFHLGAHATVHIAHDVYPTHIGNRVSAGQGAVIHACTIGDDCVIERGAVVLDGSKVGPGSVISAGSIVFPRSELEGGWLYTGSPAKPVARISATDLQAHQNKLRSDQGEKQCVSESGQTLGLDCFVAPSARVLGQVTVGEGVGVWYGCILSSGKHRIEIGSGTNIQDNSNIICVETDVIIGQDVTIGHNVTLYDCRVEPNSLVGIGSLVAPGTIVESDVLVAAGTETEPGQILTAGHVWAGRPARPLRPMNEKMRKILDSTLPTYRDYAQVFREMKHEKMGQEGQD